MRAWSTIPHTGGRPIPPAVRSRTEQRIRSYADAQYAGRSQRLDIRFRGALCLGGSVVFLVLLGVLHLVRLDIDFRSRWLSEYALGPHGWLMNAAFLALAVAEGALALGMLRGGPKSPWLRASAA